MEGRGKEEQEERGGGKGQEETEEGAGESEGPPCATEMLGEESLMEKGSIFRLSVCLAPRKPRGYCCCQRASWGISLQM